jgi:hypothetical protein
MLWDKFRVFGVKDLLTIVIFQTDLGGYGGKHTYVISALERLRQED